jgi:hypothetical protein
MCGAGSAINSRRGVWRGHPSRLDRAQLDLIVDSTEAYIETAVALASDPARLNELRPSPQARMAASSLYAPAFTRNIEHVYRTMRHRWCATHDASPIQAPVHP